MLKFSFDNLHGLVDFCFSRDRIIIHLMIGTEIMRQMVDVKIQF